MKKIKVNKRYIKTITVLILLILLFILSIIYRSNKRNYAKYSTLYDTKGFSEISKPIFKVDGNSNIKIDGENNNIYDFSVKNYESDDVSDVPLDYFIKFVNNSNANLQFILTKNGKSIELNDNETSKLTLSNKEKQEDNYKLQIKYNKNSGKFEDIKGNVQIKVEAVQSEI